MFENKVDTYLRRAGYTQMKSCWTLDKQMTSLSTCHLGLWLGRQILLNLDEVMQYDIRELPA